MKLSHLIAFTAIAITATVGSLAPANANILGDVLGKVTGVKAAAAAGAIAKQRQQSRTQPASQTQYRNEHYQSCVYQAKGQKERDMRNLRNDGKDYGLYGMGAYKKIAAINEKYDRKKAMCQAIW